MKKLLFLIIFLLSFNFVYAQEKPLTQAEYVKMLYELERKPSLKQDIIAALRTRGIDFALNSGLRSLTKSKGRNDEELKRTLEEANRRRENPEARQLPTEKEANDLLQKTRENTLAAVDDMPDFVVKQRIKRSAAFAGTGNFRSLDSLIVAVSYRAEGQEEYKLLSKNGVLQNDAQAKNSYSEVGGSSSTGEFVTVLSVIFKTESDTKFQLIDTDVINNQKTLVFDFLIDKDKAKQQITSYGYVADSTISGMKGKVWIDREKARVLKVESIATEIPADFPVRSASRDITYTWVEISGEKYLLPSMSDVRLTFRQDREMYESKNLIQFKDYQKYGTEVIILDDDEGEIPEEEIKENTEEKPPIN